MPIIREGDCTVCEFGSGDIGMPIFKMNGKTNILALIQTPEGEIGRYSKPNFKYLGDIQGEKVVMAFNDPKSIDVLIGQLENLKEKLQLR